MPAVDTAHCPFCKGTVDTDLLVFGGNCPHCLIEIPGEEAPTDPGAEAKARQESEEKAAAAQSRLWRVAGLAAGAFLVVGLTATWALWPEPELPDDTVSDWSFVPASSHEDGNYGTPGKAAPEAVASSSGRSGRSGSARSTPSRTIPVGTINSQGSTPATTTGGTITEPESAPKQAAAKPITLDDFGSIDVPIATKGPEAQVLKTDEQIQAMLSRTMPRNERQLKSCYEQSLNANPNLSGKWYIAFEITTAGRANDVVVSALNTSNPPFEACMKQKIESWTFQRLAEPLDISKNVSFTPGF